MSGWLAQANYVQDYVPPAGGGFDPNDAGTLRIYIRPGTSLMYQDIARSSAAGDGDPVRSIENLADDALTAWFTCGADAQRPLYDLNGQTFPCLDSTGDDDRLAVINNDSEMNWADTNGHTQIICYKINPYHTFNAICGVAHRVASNQTYTRFFSNHSSGLLDVDTQSVDNGDGIVFGGTPSYNFAEATDPNIVGVVIDTGANGLDVLRQGSNRTAGEALIGDGAVTGTVYAVDSASIGGNYIATSWSGTECYLFAYLVYDGLLDQSTLDTLISDIDSNWFT